MIQCEKVRTTTNALRQIRLSLGTDSRDRHQQNLLDSLLDECRALIKETEPKGAMDAIQK